MVLSQEKKKINLTAAFRKKKPWHLRRSRIPVMTDMAWKKKTVASPNLTFKKICYDALTSAETLAAADGFD